LLDINKGICYSLDAVAAQLWVTIEASQAGITLEGIVGAVENHFKVSHQELESDTSEWLEKLHRMGLVHRNGHGMPSKSFRGGR
jgi:Coenzyme PQQ synthesis protein D (PqqD)